MGEEISCTSSPNMMNYLPFGSRASKRVTREENLAEFQRCPKERRNSFGHSGGINNLGFPEKSLCNGLLDLNSRIVYGKNTDDKLGLVSSTIVMREGTSTADKTDIWCSKGELIHPSKLRKKTSKRKSAPKQWRGSNVVESHINYLHQKQRGDTDHNLSEPPTSSLENSEEPFQFWTAKATNVSFPSSVMSSQPTLREFPANPDNSIFGTKTPFPKYGDQFQPTLHSGFWTSEQTRGELLRPTLQSRRPTSFQMHSEPLRSTPHRSQPCHTTLDMETVFGEVWSAAGPQSRQQITSTYSNQDDYFPASGTVKLHRALQPTGREARGIERLSNTDKRQSQSLAIFRYSPVPSEE